MNFDEQYYMEKIPVVFDMENRGTAILLILQLIKLAYVQGNKRGLEQGQEISQKSSEEVFK